MPEIMHTPQLSGLEGAPPEVAELSAWMDAVSARVYEAQEATGRTPDSYTVASAMRNVHRALSADGAPPEDAYLREELPEMAARAVEEPQVPVTVAALQFSAASLIKAGNQRLAEHNVGPHRLLEIIARRDRPNWVFRTAAALFLRDTRRHLKEVVLGPSGNPAN